MRTVLGQDPRIDQSRDFGTADVHRDINRMLPLTDSLRLAIIESTGIRSLSRILRRSIVF